MRGRSSTVGLAAILLLAGCAVDRALDELDLVVAVDRRVERARRERGLSGLGVGLVLPDGSSFGVAVGADAAGAPLTPESRFLSGSIGKTYCAAIALQLVDEGKLALDGRVADLLGDRPWFSRIANAEEITLRQLLNHTSGIREHVWKPAFQQAVAALGDAAMSPEESLAFALDDPPVAPAGQRFAYADTNYLLAGVCIEAVTGRSFWTELEDRVLHPLGLAETGGNTGRDIVGLCCGMGSGIGFHDGPVVTDGRYFTNPVFEYCGGGVHSTPRDLARWLRELFAGDVVPGALSAEHVTAVKAPRAVSGGYGLGCFVGPSPHGPALGHSGIMPGYLSYALWFPELQVAVAVMVPTDDVRAAGDLRGLCCELAGMVAGEAGASARHGVWMLPRGDE